MPDVGKKEAAAISAAIVARLTRQDAPESASDSEIQAALASLGERVSELEKKVGELTAALREALVKTEGKK